MQPHPLLLGQTPLTGDKGQAFSYNDNNNIDDDDDTSSLLYARSLGD